jgi:hypothetical protein
VQRRRFHSNHAASRSGDPTESTADTEQFAAIIDVAWNRNGRRGDNFQKPMNITRKNQRGILYWGWAPWLTETREL